MLNNKLRRPYFATLSLSKIAHIDNSEESMIMDDVGTVISFLVLSLAPEQISHTLILDSVTSIVTWDILRDNRVTTSLAVLVYWLCPVEAAFKFAYST